MAELKDLIKQMLLLNELGGNINDAYRKIKGTVLFIEKNTGVC